VIADLAVNHVERHGLLAGHTFERYWHDYGVDLMMNTYSAAGEYENGAILFQVKATDNLRLVGREDSVAVRVETTHLDHWISEPMPFILIAYDAEADAAYWVYLQAHFASIGRSPSQLGASITIRIPRSQVFDGEAVRLLVALKNERIASRERSTRDEAQ
jgi:hypothetical protein